jgi:hypothetical protein
LWQKVKDAEMSLLLILILLLLIFMVCHSSLVIYAQPTSP